MKTYHLGETCPSCRQTLGAVSSENGLPPEPGDPTLCWGCGAILCFDEGLHMKVLTSWEGISARLRARLEAISAKRRKEINES